MSPAEAPGEATANPTSDPTELPTRSLSMLRDPRSLPVEAAGFLKPLFIHFAPITPPPDFWSRDVCVRSAIRNPGAKAHKFSSECVWDSVDKEIRITFPRGTVLRMPYSALQYVVLVPETIKLSAEVVAKLHVGDPWDGGTISGVDRATLTIQVSRQVLG